MPYSLDGNMSRGATADMDAFMRVRSEGPGSQRPATSAELKFDAPCSHFRPEESQKRSSAPQTRVSMARIGGLT